MSDEFVSDLYKALLNAPENAPVFFSDKLDKQSLLEAYKFGLFPWTNAPVSWWCPNPRMVLAPREIYRQKSVRRFFSRYEIRLDTAFTELMRLCAGAREHSWIDDDFVSVYSELFKDGVAHSVEIYENDTLVGGLYGLIIGKMFFGESMVSLAKNASKLAMIALCELLTPYDFLIDCQIYNPHLAFMGAKTMQRAEFLGILEQKVRQKSDFDEFKNLALNFNSLFHKR